MYKTILFDFDGTIADSLPLWMQGFKYALAQYRVNLDEDQVIKECFYRPHSEIAERFEIPCSNAFFDHLQAGLRIAFSAPTLFPSVYEVLGRCRQAGVSTGIVTSSFRHLVSPALAKLEVEGFFDVVITAEDVSNLKPDPEPINLALSRVGGSPESTLLVGDSHADILAGKAAGTHTALFLPESHSRFYSFESLRAHEPSLAFSHHDDLLTHLGSVFATPRAGC